MKLVVIRVPSCTSFIGTVLTKTAKGFAIIKKTEQIAALKTTRNWGFN